MSMPPKIISASNCWIVKDLLQKVGKNLKRGFKVQRSHRQVIGKVIPNYQLVLKVFKRRKFVKGIKIFIIAPVRTLHFAVMPRCVRAYSLIFDIISLKLFLK